LGLGFGGGKSGSIRFHNSSVSSGLAIAVSSKTRAIHRPRRRSYIRFC
jgi:hypothetical protein